MRGFGNQVLSKLRLSPLPRTNVASVANIQEVRLGEGVVYLDLDRDEYSCCYDPLQPLGMYRSLVGCLQCTGVSHSHPIGISQWRERDQSSHRWPSVVDMARFTIALIRAGLRFRRRSLHDLGTIANRLGRVPRRQTLDAAQAANLFGFLLAMTPLRPKCLFGSFFLLHFLDLYGVRADWIFGVQLFPFRAHCWLVDDGQLLNETPHGIEDYEVIWSVGGRQR